MIIEMQTRYIAKVFANKCKLPNKKDLITAYINMKKKQDKEFGYDNKRVTGIIDPYDYMNMIAYKINVMPSFTKLLFINPKLLLGILCNTWSHFIYRLNDNDNNAKKIAREQLLALYNDDQSHLIMVASKNIIISYIVIFIIFILIILYRKNIIKFFVK